MQHQTIDSFYHRHTQLVNTINDLLLERLDYLNLHPSHILICSPYNADFEHAIQVQFPQANLTQLDLTSAAKITAPANHFDLMILNLAWCWLDELPAHVAEIRRVIKAQGSLLLTTLEPTDHQDLQAEASKCVDMHDLGDLLLNAGFVDPVMDVEHLTLDVIFGYARGPSLASYQTQAGEIAIPVSSINYYKPSSNKS